MLSPDAASNHRTRRAETRTLAFITGGLLVAASGCNNQYVAAGTCDEPQVLEGDHAHATAAINTTADFMFHCGSAATALHPSRIFQWKPASTGTAQITLGGVPGHTNVDTVLDLVGSDCTSEIMCDDDCNGPGSCLTLNVVAGRTYTLAAGTFAASPTAVSVDLNIQVTPAPPPVEDGGVPIADAGMCAVPSQILFGDNVTSVGTVTANATYQFHCGSTGRPQPSYAFQWTPQSTGTAQIALTGDAMLGTVLDVSGTDCLTDLACNANLPSSRIAMNVTAGQAYTIVTSTLVPSSSPESVTLSILVTPNSFLDGGVVSGGNACVNQATQTLTTPVVNSVGTLSSSNPFRFHCVSMATPQPSYTFQWRAPASGIVQANLREDGASGSVLDVVAQDCNTEIACNAAPASFGASLTMNVTAGQLYNFVAGTLPTAGQSNPLPNAYLNLELTPTPSPDAGVSMLDAGSEPDASLDTAPPDAGPARCMGSVAFTCPTTIDCTDGNGGALTYSLGCAAEQSTTVNVCGEQVVNGEGQIVSVPLDPSRQCLPTQISCYGPDESLWHCPTRWLLSSEAGTTHASGCCYWDTSGAIAHGACGVPSGVVAAGCAAPPAGAQPE